MSHNEIPRPEWLPDDADFSNDPELEAALQQDAAILRSQGMDPYTGTHIETGADMLDPSVDRIHAMRSAIAALLITPQAIPSFGDYTPFQELIVQIPKGDVTLRGVWLKPLPDDAYIISAELASNYDGFKSFAEGRASITTIKDWQLLAGNVSAWQQLILDQHYDKMRKKEGDVLFNRWVFLGYGFFTQVQSKYIVTPAEAIAQFEADWAAGKVPNHVKTKMRELYEKAKPKTKPLTERASAYQVWINACSERKARIEAAGAIRSLALENRKELEAKVDLILQQEISRVEKLKLDAMESHARSMITIETEYKKARDAWLEVKAEPVPPRPA